MNNRNFTPILPPCIIIIKIATIWITIFKSYVRLVCINNFLDFPWCQCLNMFHIISLVYTSLNRPYYTISTFNWMRNVLFQFSQLKSQSFVFHIQIWNDFLFLFGSFTRIAAFTRIYSGKCVNNFHVFLFIYGLPECVD